MAHNHRPFQHNGKLKSLNAWPDNWKGEEFELKKYKLGTATTPTLLCQDDVVLATMGFDFKDGKIYAHHIDNGRLLWTSKHHSSGQFTRRPFCHQWSRMVRCHCRSASGWHYDGHHLKSGEVATSFPPNVKSNFWFHQRCYRSKATAKYVIPVTNGHRIRRPAKSNLGCPSPAGGACLNGVLPANGMTYITPHPCACNTESMLRGFSGLVAPEMQKAVTDLKETLALSKVLLTIHLSKNKPRVGIISVMAISA